MGGLPLDEKSNSAEVPDGLKEPYCRIRSTESKREAGVE